MSSIVFVNVSQHQHGGTRPFLVGHEYQQVN